MDKRPRGGLVPEARAGMPSGPMDSGGAPLPGSPSRATFWGGGGAGDGGGGGDGGGSAAGESSGASVGAAASLGGMSAGSLAAEQQDPTFGIFGLSRGSSEVMASLGQYVTGTVVPVKPGIPWKPKPRPVLGGNQGDPVQVHPVGNPSGGLKTGGGGLHGTSGSTGDDNGSGGSGLPQAPSNSSGKGAPVVVTGGRHAARATLGNASGEEGGPPLAPPSLVAVPFGVDTSGVLTGGAGESAGEQLEGGGGNWGGAAPAAYAGSDDNSWTAPRGVAPGPPVESGHGPAGGAGGRVAGLWRLDRARESRAWPRRAGGISRLHVRRADGNAGAGMGSNARCGPMVVETRHGRAGNGGQSLLALCRRRGRLGDRPGKPDEQAADGRSGGPRVSLPGRKFRCRHRRPISTTHRRRRRFGMRRRPFCGRGTMGPVTRGPGRAATRWTRRARTPLQTRHRPILTIRTRMQNQPPKNDNDDSKKDNGKDKSPSQSSSTNSDTTQSSNDGLPSDGTGITIQLSSGKYAITGKASTAGAAQAMADWYAFLVGQATGTEPGIYLKPTEDGGYTVSRRAR